MSAWLRVNEARIVATRRGADWWFDYRSRADRTNRPFRVVASTLGGELVEREYESEAEAQMMAGLFAGMGIPDAALKVWKRPTP